MMDKLTYRKLKAKKRRHRKKYSIKFMINVMSDHGSIKSWDFECRQDVIDMLKSISIIATTMKVWNEKESSLNIIQKNMLILGF